MGGPARLGEANQFAPTSASVNHTTAAEMVADLIEAAVRRMREADTKADENNDLVTTDMLTDRLNFHEKTLWMSPPDERTMTCPVDPRQPAGLRPLTNSRSVRCNADRQQFPSLRHSRA